MIPKELLKYGVEGPVSHRNGNKRRLIATCVGEPGTGKCLGKGTRVLMHNGSIKPVEQVVNGDMLMGPDSLPRMVSGTITGTGKLFKVIPIKGDPYVVNSKHILSLLERLKDGSRRLVNLNVQDYLSSNKTRKHHLKGWRTGVEFQTRDVLMDPYLLGVWLGDGDSGRMAITNPEPEILEYFSNAAISYGLSAKDYGHYGTATHLAATHDVRNRAIKNPMKDILISLGVLHNKHVPMEYKVNSRKVRLQLLAGLLDTDGYLNHGLFEIISVHDQLAMDILYICRSLGFAAYDHPKIVNGASYHLITISGDTQSIPTKVPRKQADKRRQIKDAMVTGIHIEPAGSGQFFGFSLDRDGLFMLGDFTVTHNTDLMLRTAPRPLLAINLDRNLEPLMERYKSDQDLIIKTVRLTKDINQDVDGRIWDSVWNLYHDAITKNLVRSILLDTGDAMYELVRRAKLGTLDFGEVPQSAYSVVNASMKAIYSTAKDSQVNLLITHRFTNEYKEGTSRSGKKISVATGARKVSGWKDAVYESPFHIELLKNEKLEGNNRFSAIIRKATGNSDAEGQEMVGDDITWKNLGLWSAPWTVDTPEEWD